ncbi:hypothetical protein D3C77_769440 [compost metagenome]
MASLPRDPRMANGVGSVSSYSAFQCGSCARISMVLATHASSVAINWGCDVFFTKSPRVGILPK